MSNTRHAKDPTVYHQHRFMSDPLLAEQRGLLGNLVAERAALLLSRSKRELIFFLQGESLKPGGLKRVAQEIVTMFPERLGTPTMHRVGNSRAAVYGAKEAQAIEDELCDTTAADRALRELFDHDEKTTRRLTRNECLTECRSAAERLDSFLADLCLNPRLSFHTPGEDPALHEFEEEEAEKSLRETSGYSRAASVPYFRDIIGALFEYQSRKQKEAAAGLVETSISRTIAERK